MEASWTRIVNGESNDGVLVVKYVDVGRRGQLGGGDKRADSCHRHEARQGSPPFNPAQDQLGRDDMVAGEDGLADFCEFGIDPLAGVGIVHRAGIAHQGPGVPIDGANRAGAEAPPRRTGHRAR